MKLLETDGGADIATMTDADLRVRLAGAWDANQGDDLRKLRAELDRRIGIEPTTYLGDIPTSIATAAHAGSSFVPERRAEQEQTSYASTLAQDYAALVKYADTLDKRDHLREEFARYRSGFRSRYVAKLTADSRTLSSMITGPSNFPTARNRKRLDAAQGKLDDLLGYRERALDAIRKVLRPELRPVMAGDDDAVERLREKIAKAEALQEQMKQVNLAIRKHAKGGTEAQVAAIVALGYKEASARSVLEPDFAGRVGIPSYQLTNNNANIRRMKLRLDEISAAKVAPVAEVAGEHARFEDNPADNRVRLYFPGKPDREVRERLKGSGFRWAPSLGCWQAYRNHRTIATARREAGEASEACTECKGAGEVYTAGQVTVECEACHAE